MFQYSLDCLSISKYLTYLNTSFMIYELELCNNIKKLSLYRIISIEHLKKLSMKK